MLYTNTSAKGERTEFTVNVTREHITAGKRRHPWLCPVARAVRDALGLRGDVPVSVGSDRLNIGTERYHLPRPVADWIWEYDTGLSVEPFTFTIDTVRDAYPEPEAEDDESGDEPCG